MDVVEFALGDARKRQVPHGFGAMRRPLADSFGLDVQLLLGKEVERKPETQNCIDQVEVEEIRAALERYDQMSAFFQPTPHCPPLPEMRKAVSHAWLTYQHAKYGVLARTLPKLLRDAQAASATTLDGELMLLHQGGAAFTLWTGQPAPLDLMQSRLAEARAGGLRSAEGEPTGEPAVAAAE